MSLWYSNLGITAWLVTEHVTEAKDDRAPTSGHASGASMSGTGTTLGTTLLHKSGTTLRSVKGLIELTHSGFGRYTQTKLC